MTERILSISGLRGVIGDGLDPLYLTRFAAALGTMYEGGTVVVSRDGRATGEMVRHAVMSSANAAMLLINTIYWTSPFHLCKLHPTLTFRAVQCLTIKN